MLDVIRYKCRNSDSSLPQINLTSFASSDSKKYNKSLTLIHIELCSEYITWTLADAGVKWFSELYMFGGGSQKLSIDNKTNSSFCCFLSSSCTQTLHLKIALSTFTILTCLICHYNIYVLFLTYYCASGVHPTLTIYSIQGNIM